VRVTVRVPATSANLGPGFDAFGLALDLCNDVRVDTDATPGVAWEGEGAAELPTDGTDMVSRTVASVAERMQLDVPAFSLHGVNRIPLERGLGSSSAAAVAGVVLASCLLDLGIHRDASSVFALAAQIEGHPDNAGAAVFGGFTIAMPEGSVRCLRPHPDLRPVVLVPDDRLPTDRARRALPATVARDDAVFNAAHAALMTIALTQDPTLLPLAIEDRVHQSVRLDLVPDVRDVFEAIRAANIAVCVSGAGPSLLAFERDEVPFPDEGELGLDGTWRVLRLRARERGPELIDD
jgi:homoserine kinase